ncbi:hypothetical protein Bca4012_065447 [Brassica carinata]
METIMRSQFGRLFELPVARCYNSAKLIHSFLCRQLVTVRKYELWFHFATHPLRFSLDEFQQVPELNCGAFDGDDSEEEDAPGSTIATDNFLVDPMACEKAVTILNVNDIVQVEEDPAISLHFYIRLTVQFKPIPESERFLWLDEVEDDRVTHLVELIVSGHQFQTSDLPGADSSFAPIPEENKNADKPTGQSVRQRKLRKGVVKVEKPNAQPIHQRNLHPHKPPAVIIEDTSSSEASEPQGPPQPVRCTHEDLKPWMEQKFEQLAIALQKHVAELSTNFCCSRCGLSEATTQQTRRRKENDDDHGLSGSPKGVYAQSEQTNRKGKRTKTAVTTPSLRKNSYSLRSGDGLWSGDNMDVSDEVNKATTSSYADIDIGDVDDDANEGIFESTTRNDANSPAKPSNAAIVYKEPLFSTVNQKRPIPADLLPVRFKDEKPVNVTWGESNPHLYTSGIRATATDPATSVASPDCEVLVASTIGEKGEEAINLDVSNPKPLSPIIEDTESGTPVVQSVTPTVEQNMVETSNLEDLNSGVVAVEHSSSSPDLAIGG